MADDTYRYVDSFVAALRECGHSQADIRRAILTVIAGETAPALPEPCVKGPSLSLFTVAQMQKYAKDYSAAILAASNVCGDASGTTEGAK